MFLAPGRRDGSMLRADKPRRKPLSSANPTFLCGRAAFDGGPVAACGRLCARRGSALAARCCSPA
ncbi:hypothetical protein GCM10007858_56000 [Bradyrhizobium liaoningense]|nr:hypothetical protein GCM10007858_56000 [Bradyrhizobium liaoningense]